MPSWLMLGLLIEYIAFAGTFAVMGRWVLALYFVGCSVLQTAVMMGVK